MKNIIRALGNILQVSLILFLAFVFCGYFAIIKDRYLFYSGTLFGDLRISQQLGGRIYLLLESRPVAEISSNDQWTVRHNMVYGTFLSEQSGKKGYFRNKGFFIYDCHRQTFEKFFADEPFEKRILAAHLDSAEILRGDSLYSLQTVRRRFPSECPKADAV